MKRHWRTKKRENKRKNSELNFNCVLARPISFDTSVCVFFRTYYFESSVLVVGIYRVCQLLLSLKVFSC